MRRVGVALCLAAAVGLAQAPNIGPGVVADGSYMNPSIGLTFKPPPKLALREPQIRASGGKLPTSVSVSAEGASGSIIFYADPLGGYPPNLRSAERYLGTVVRGSAAAEGFEPIGAAGKFLLSGNDFLRRDFVKDAGFHAVLVTTHNDFADVFTFNGPNPDDVQKLIDSTKVEFTDGKPEPIEPSSSGSKLEYFLKQMFLNRVMILRHFYTLANLTFDNEGKLLENVKPGSWTDGQLYVKYLSLLANKLVFEGPRIKAVFSKENNRFDNILQSDSVRVELTLASDDPSQSEILKLVSSVFLNAGDNVESMVPPEQRPAVRLWQLQTIEDLKLPSQPAR